MAIKQFGVDEITVISNFLFDLKDLIKNPKSLNEFISGLDDAKSILKEKDDVYAQKAQNVATENFLKKKESDLEKRESEVNFQKEKNNSDAADLKAGLQKLLVEKEEYLSKFRDVQSKSSLLDKKEVELNSKTEQLDALIKSNIEKDLELSAKIKEINDKLTKLKEV